MPLPPSSPVTTTWKASPLYRLEHGSHTDVSTALQDWSISAPEK
jgi:hypothetical protein